MKQSWRIFSIVILAGFLSCSSPQELVYNRYKNLQIEKIGFGNSAVRLDLEYYNPNYFGLQLKRSELDITLNGAYLGKSTSDTLIYIPRRDTFTLPIKFEVDMKNLFKNAFTTLGGKEVLVKVNGKIKVGKANVYMSMPIDYEGKHSFSIF